MTTTTTTTTRQRLKCHHSRSMVSIVVAVLVVLVARFDVTRAGVFCGTNTSICQERLQSGSICAPNGFCTNPFASGCLVNVLGREVAQQYMPQQLRACNSEDAIYFPHPVGNNDQGPVTKNGNDDDDDDDSGEQRTDRICFHSEFDYPEIRISSGNWESSIFISWILQILLSELLGVPATIDPGLSPSKMKATTSTTTTSFYDIENYMNFEGVTYNWDGIRTSLEYEGDCQKAIHQDGKPCCHIIPEVWPGQRNVYTQLEEEGTIEFASSIDVVGRLGLYIPRFLAEQDLTLTSHLGLVGQTNRQKLATIFKKPTTWAEYCNDISQTECQQPDDVAMRRPQDDSESVKYFMEGGVYRGYFRETVENDCEANPTNCTGHFVDGRCDWSSLAQAQIYWNDIALTSTGPDGPYGWYDYSSMIDIWMAANETRSAVMMWWWSTDWMMQNFIGSPAEFTRVNLPVPFLECIENRVDEDGRCSNSPTLQRGSQLGSCDYEPAVLRKIISSTVKETQENVRSAYKSGGLELIEKVSLSDVTIDFIMKEWIMRKVDPFGYDGRHVVCHWVANNLDTLLKTVPKGYPRKVAWARDTFEDTAGQTAFALAVFTGVCSIVAAILTFQWRKRKIVRAAQPDFLYIILSGFLFLSAASLLYSLEPQRHTCIIRQWFILLGASLELLPLIVKVQAIIKAIRYAHNFRRVKIRRSRLFGAVALFIGVVILYLTAWTILDPPIRREELVLRDEEVNDLGGSVVEKQITCASNHDGWILGALGWQFTLLFCATVMAFQTRNIQSDFNESQFLGFMIYTHFMFALLRLLLELFMSGSISPENTMVITSFLLSLDTLVTLNIYFTPKFVTVVFFPSRNQVTSSFQTATSGQAGAWSNGTFLQASNGTDNHAGGDGSSVAILNSSSIHVPPNITQSDSQIFFESVTEESKVLESVPERGPPPQLQQGGTSKTRSSDHKEESPPPKEEAKQQRKRATVDKQNTPMEEINVTSSSRTVQRSNI